MFAIIGLMGMAGFLVCLVLFLVTLIRKKTKKKVVVSAVVFLALFVVGISLTPSDSNENTNLVEKISVKEYTCMVDDSFRYYVLILSNNSDKVVEIEANMVAKDSSGDPVEAHSDSTQAVSPGQTAGIWTTFDDWERIKTLGYELQVREDQDDSSILGKVLVDIKTLSNKVVAQATNIGENPANYVWLDVVFLKNEKMVGFSEISLTNSDAQLLPGASITAEGECFSETGFDDVVIALNGRY